MPDTNTPNLNLMQPEVGASDDTWGTKLNADFAIIDALFATTGEGTVVTRDIFDFVDAHLGVDIYDAAGSTDRAVQFGTGTAAGTAHARWSMGATADAESGSNAGSNFALTAFADDGETILSEPLGINRATGVTKFPVAPEVGADAVMTTATTAAAISAASTDPGVGEVRMWDGTADPVSPAGSTAVWMIADGRLISRTTFAAYFAKVGTHHGAGDGTTTFAILDMKGNGPTGFDAAAATTPGTNTMGAKIGEAEHTLTVAEAPTGINTPNFNDDGHTMRCWVR